MGPHQLVNFCSSSDKRRPVHVPVCTYTHTKARTLTHSRGGHSFGSCTINLTPLEKYHVGKKHIIPAKIGRDMVLCGSETGNGIAHSNWPTKLRGCTNNAICSKLLNFTTEAASPASQAQFLDEEIEEIECNCSMCTTKYVASHLMVKF